MGRTFTKMRRGDQQRARRGVPFAAPVAPPRGPLPPPCPHRPGISMLAAAGGQAGEGSSGIAARAALWAALASAGDHLLAVNASPARLGRRRGNGGRRIKERVCLHPGHRSGGRAGSSWAARSPRTVCRAEGACDHLGGLRHSPLPLGFAKAWELPPLQEEAGVPKRSREQKAL